MRLMSRALFCLIVLGGVRSGHAATHVVTRNGDDASAGSLRWAIAAAASGDTIRFDAAHEIDLSVVGDSAYGPTALLIDKVLIIDGNGGVLRRSAGVDNLRFFRNTSSLVLSNLTLMGGRARGYDGGGYGGASGGGGGGAGGLGGAIFNQAELELWNCTMASNQAIGGNGGPSLGLNTWAGGGGGLSSAGSAGGSDCGGNGGAPNGGAGESASVGSAGGPGGGGGGAGTSSGTTGYRGGTGGFGGGGGGGGQAPLSGATGGSGGSGGFGGGGGGGGNFNFMSGRTGWGGSGGFGGGAGGSSSGFFAGTGGGGGGLGGALFGTTGSRIRARNCTFAANQTQGGLSSQTQLGSGANSGGGYGGAIFCNGGELDLMDCTLSGNTAPSGGRGVYCGNLYLSFLGYQSQTTVKMWNVIMGETDTSGTEFAGENVVCTQAVSSIVRTSGGLTNVTCLTGDPLLLPLADNGGATPTMALRDGSAAYRAGTPSGLSTDQRGVSRGDPPCIGAIEYSTTLTGQVGVALSQALPGFGGGGYGGFAVIDGAFPAGTTLTSDGVWSGTPTAGGAFAVAASATNGSGENRQYYIGMIGPPALVLAPSALPGGQVDQIYAQAFATEGGTGPHAYTLESGALPPSFTLSSAGMLRGYPAEGGTHTFSVRSTDSSGGAGPYAVTRTYRLTILSGTECASVPSGIAGWWRGEGDARDSAATNHGVGTGGVSYEPGKVGQAIRFDGATGAVELPGGAAGRIADTFTIEFWAFPEASRETTAETNSGCAGLSGQRYALYPGHGGDTSAGVGVSVGVNGVSVFEHGGGYLPSVLVHDMEVTGWTHIAVVYEERRPRLYVNGAMVRTGVESGRGSVHPMFSFSGPYGYYAGWLDEVGVYDRALSEEEIAGIANAGLHGKCVDRLPPVVLVHPASQALAPGESAQFSVAVTGAPPVFVQWWREGGLLPGETNLTLALPDVRMGVYGGYHAVAGNAHGAATSAVASLTVTEESCVGVPAGVVSWWRGEGDAWDAIAEQGGTLVSNVTFAAGRVGQGFRFDGSNSCVALPAAPGAGVSNTFTIEFWAWPAAGRDTTVETNDGIWGIGGQRYAIFPALIGESAVSAGVSVGTNGVSVFEHGGGHLPSVLVCDTVLAGWTHIAVVYEDKRPTLFLNGSPVRVGLASGRGSVHPAIGFSGAYGYYEGLLDEVSIYDRALSGDEVMAIWLAGTNGKCGADALPFRFDGAIHGPAMSGDGFRLRLVGGDGLPTVLYTSSNLVEWIPSRTNPGSLGPVEFWDGGAIPSPRFYKAGPE